MKSAARIRRAARALLLLTCLISSGCDKSVAPASDATAASPVAVPSANQLSMTIDGVPWVADQNLFGAFHPAGYDRALIIAGSLGPRDANEQTFNLNLYANPGPGHYRITQGNAQASVVQIANLSRERYLAGSVLGFDFDVNVLKAQSTPTVIEATFAGTLTVNDGSVLTIADGRFAYRE
jgi:hypothetical protein